MNAIKILILGAALAASTGIANAQQWTETIGQQLAVSLDSQSDQIRARALHQVMQFAIERPDIDLAPVVPRLVEMYRSDGEERYRLAAAVALHALADEDAMQAMRAGLERQTSPRVQLVSIAILRDYYGLRTFANSAAAAEMASELIKDIRTPSPTLASR